MNLTIYDNNLAKIAIIGNQFVSCLWQEKYNALGSFSLEVVATEYLKTKIRPGYYVVRSDFKTAMVIKTVEISEGTIVATGATAEKQLDNVAFIGTIAANKDIVTSLKSVYNSSSKFPRIEIVDSDVVENYASQISNKSILELIQTVCESNDIGFKAVKGTKNIEIVLYKPSATKNLVFRKEYGNLADEEIKLSTEKYKNYAIVLGQGEAENRVRVDVDMSGGGVKHELIVDAKDLQQEETETEEDYKARLIARGKEKLLEQVKTWNVSFTVSAADYGVKFRMGDIITVIMKDYDLKIQARITEFKQKEQKNKINTGISVGSLTVIRRGTN